MSGTGQWFPDPTGRSDRRYWDGKTWTDQVSRGGTQATDSISFGYARPEQFRFHEKSAFHAKPADGASGTVWWDIVGRFQGQLRVPSFRGARSRLSE
jgi:hypothetical protein